MWENILVGVILVLALAYIVIYNIRKVRRMRREMTGACGHRCDACPFAKYSEDGVRPCSREEKKWR